MEIKNPRYDLLLLGGSVYSAADQLWRKLDVAISDGRIAAIGEHLDKASATIRADVTGQIVAPGLVDLHVHAYDGATYWGFDVAEVSSRSGVTTVVDAGSAGPYNFSGLASQLRASPVRSFAFLNIAPAGLVTPFGELLEPGTADVAAAVRVARQFPDLVIGFKLRASPNTVGPNAIEALQAVRQAADETGKRVMVHVSDGPPDLEAILSFLKAGDVLTHCFTPYSNSVITASGAIPACVQAALKCGVLLDVGHGSGSFSFPIAEAWARSGLCPAITSTDLHRRSVLGPAFDLNTVMTKLLAAGNSLEAVLNSVTRLPLDLLQLPVELDVGADADIAVITLEERPITLFDSRGISRTSERRFRNSLTVQRGQVRFAHPELRLVGA